jgi:uncharacterized protein (DUF736 family)
LVAAANPSFPGRTCANEHPKFNLVATQVSIVAAYIKERTRNAQFIVISLRNNMFELAERLIGIYKVNHMTKSVTVENRDYLLGPGAAGGGET